VDADEKACLVPVGQGRTLMQRYKDVPVAGEHDPYFRKLLVDKPLKLEGYGEGYVLLLADFAHTSRVVTTMACINHHSM